MRRREERRETERKSEERKAKKERGEGRRGEDGRKMSGGLEHDWFFTYGGQVAWIQRRETPV